MRGRMVLALAAMMAFVAGSAAAADEQLVMKPYPGPPAWKRITDKSGPQGWIHEQIPADRRDDDYSDMLTDQGFAANRGVDPSAFLRNIFANVGGACAGVKVSGPVARTEGGLRVAYGQVRCGTERGQAFGVHIFYKAISGDTALYSISREFRVPASADGDQLVFPKAQAAKAAALLKAEAAADRYLMDQVYVCGGRSTDPKCRR
ncbi:MAG TPA: hypothetical protein VN814_06950 [Caulobacteraceae bacterium]|nr:hypothetical protein [Caulobacteraceae bacterium]